MERAWIWLVGATALGVWTTMRSHPTFVLPLIGDRNPWLSTVMIRSSFAHSIPNDHRIIQESGWNSWIYQHDPHWLPFPDDATVENAHGIFIDDTTGMLLLTYQDSNESSPHCLLRWNRSHWDQPGEILLTTAGSSSSESMCQGVPHGLRAVQEGHETFLYHANNAQALHKTHLDGSLVWSVHGPPVANDNHKNETSTPPTPPLPYHPTWFAAPPDSPYRWMADGYGSSKVYLYTSDGIYTNHSHGGFGTAHGRFRTSHAISWDDRRRQMVVADRENHRLEYFDVDLDDPSVFVYSTTTSLLPWVRRPCHIRYGNSVIDDDNDDESSSLLAIVPGLEGTVAILNRTTNSILSVVNVSDVWGNDEGFWHPHDAHFVPGTRGDFVLATWNPGRIGYFRRVEPARTTRTINTEVAKK